MIEIAFFTNEIALAIYTLINYKHILPTYVPCMHYCNNCQDYYVEVSCLMNKKFD